MISDDLLSGPQQIRLNRRSRIVTVADRPITISAYGFDILSLLLSRRGEVIPFDEFARTVWGYEQASSNRFIQTAIWRLRRALDSAGATDVVENVNRVGYVIWGAAAEQARLDELRASEQPVVIVSRTGEIRFANAAAAEATGYPLEDLRKMNATEIWRPGDQDVHRALRDAAIKNATAIASGLAYYGDGRVVPIEVSLTALDLGTDEPVFLITSAAARTTATRSAVSGTPTA